MDDLRIMHPTPVRADRLRLAYLYGGSVRYRPGESLGPRRLADYELVLLIEGNALYETCAHCHKLAPGDLVLARPGFRERYTWDTHHPTRHAFFHFGIEAIPRAWPGPEWWPAVHSRPDPAVERLFQSVLRRSHSRPGDPPSRPPRLDSQLVEVIIELLLDRSDGPSLADEVERPQPVASAVTWMRGVLEENPQQALTLADLARHAGVSPKHLCRTFRRSLGHPPMATLRLLRLQLALALLVRSSLAVKEIATRCGFADPLYFSRCFSATFGRPPRRVRDDLLRGIPPPGNPLPPDVTPRIHW